MPPRGCLRPGRLQQSCPQAAPRLTPSPLSPVTPHLRSCKTCTTGFALQGNRCIECTDARGMVVSTKGRCQCKLGLEFNKDKTQCVAPTAAEAETD